jgi:hypothetical protein
MYREKSCNPACELQLQSNAEIYLKNSLQQNFHNTTQYKTIVFLPCNNPLKLTPGRDSNSLAYYPEAAMLTSAPAIVKKNVSHHVFNDGILSSSPHSAVASRQSLEHSEWVELVDSSFYIDHEQGGQIGANFRQLGDCRVARFFLVRDTKAGKMYQTQIVPNEHKLYQMVIKYPNRP